MLEFNCRPRIKT